PRRPADTTKQRRSSQMTTGSLSTCPAGRELCQCLAAVDQAPVRAGAIAFDPGLRAILAQALAQRLSFPHPKELTSDPSLWQLPPTCSLRSGGVNRFGLLDYQETLGRPIRRSNEH